MVRIENALLIADLSEHGAELKRLQSKKTQRHYIYDGSATWKRSAPVLFPNIGGLAGERFVHKGVEYPAPAHGFARDMRFQVVEHDREMVRFSLESNEETEKNYPFRFSLDIVYTLEENRLSVSWIVKNHGDETMYFSIGAHPGFNLLPDTGLRNYVLYFDKVIPVETRRVIGRYLTEEKERIVENCNTLPLSNSLLEKDAIILEDTGVQRIALKNHKEKYHLWVEFPGFPVVAIWTDPHGLKDCRFLCIEPWCGINSLVHDPIAEISEKARINALRQDAEFKKTYTIGIEE